MRLVWQILLALVLGAVIYYLMVGLGITRSFKKHKTDKNVFVLDDFESPNQDLDWRTDGYVKLESSKENQSHGKLCAKATFLLASQFNPQPTEAPTPVVAVPVSQVNPNPILKNPSKAPQGKVKAPAAVPTLAPPNPTPTPENTWQPSTALSSTSVTRLPTFDWSGFTTLKLDVFNPQDHPVTYFLKVADGKTFTHEMSGVLNSKKVTAISLPFDDLVKDRLDLNYIQSISFRVDVTGAIKPVEVYLDYLRLEQEPVTAPKK